MTDTDQPLRLTYQSNEKVRLGRVPDGAVQELRIRAREALGDDVDLIEQRHGVSGDQPFTLTMDYRRRPPSGSVPDGWTLVPAIPRAVDDLDG